MDFKLKDFVPTERRVDLVGLTIQEAIIDGIVNPMLLAFYFDVNSVLIYADIDIPLEQKADKLALYDTFIQEKVFSQFDEMMCKQYPGEREANWAYLELWVKEYRARQNSIYGIIDSVSDFVNVFLEKTDIKIEDLKNLQLGELGQIIPLAKELGFDLEKKE
jgi:hypothetical protein